MEKRNIGLVHELLASVYHLTRLEYGIDQPEKVCIKIFVARKNPRIPSIFWVWKSADFQEKELSLTLWKNASIMKLGHFRREFVLPDRLS